MLEVPEPVVQRRSGNSGKLKKFLRMSSVENLSGIVPRGVTETDEPDPVVIASPLPSNEVPGDVWIGRVIYSSYMCQSRGLQILDLFLDYFDVSDADRPGVKEKSMCWHQRV